jgi:pilus assembly protein CpaC
MIVKSLRGVLLTTLSSAVALAPGFAMAQVEPPNASSVHITSGGAGSQSASLVLPFGKSAIVDLPADARDILISNPAIADATVRTARRAYVIGRQIGQTNIFFFDAGGRQIANVEIRVEPDVAPLNDLLHRQSPDTQIRAEAVNGSIVLSGNARSASQADQAQQLAQSFLSSPASAGGASGAGGPASSGPSAPHIVNLIQVQGSEQVMVRVRVVEMSRTLIRQLGINLNYNQMINQLLNSDNFINAATSEGFSVNGAALGGLAASTGIARNILQPSGLAYPSPGVVSPTLSPDSGGVAGYTVDPQTGQVTYGPASLVTDKKTEASIQAFERAGLLRVLAEPNLTAISGEAAHFLAGGEFPVPVNSDDGRISVQFKPFGVGLAITPVVMSGGMISLKVATEVSELTSEGAIQTGDVPVRNSDGTTTVIHGITIPALQVRRAETTLEMSSGGSMVLAGLIQERTRQAMEGVPGVMDTPVIGSLFRSRDFLNNETELVIIVTPYLVRETSRDRIHTPADGYMDPGEGESLLSGRLNAMYRPPDSADHSQGLQGPHGHVIQ